MNQLKRKSSSDHLSQKFQSIILIISKYFSILELNLGQSVSCLEDLSNECFYEIFDYLEACQIYEIFSKLNSRFHQLMNSSALFFRIKLRRSQPENKYFDHFEQMLIHHRHQIYSIHSLNTINMSQTWLFSSIDSSYDHLESIVFKRTTVDVLIPLLRQCLSLPRLFSLNINMDDRLNKSQITDIYRTIFSLSKLKSLKFRTLIRYESHIRSSLSLARNDEYTHIQYLYLDHSMDLNELFSIVSYTPELSQLIVSDIAYTRKLSIENRMEILLLNLRYFSIQNYNSKFYELEVFFRKINCKKLEIFKTLKFYAHGDYIYFNRWEIFVQTYLPYLKRIYLEYDEFKNSKSEILDHPFRLKQFFSLFWIQKQMIFKIGILHGYIRYMISPYR